MPKLYNVHLYREMILCFQDVHADTPLQAAEACRERSCDDAAKPANDCDGETFGALVDLQGDSDYSESILVDFEGERLRKAASQLLEALQEAVAEIVHWHANMLSEEERQHPRGSGWARVYDKAMVAITAAQPNS